MPQCESLKCLTHLCVKMIANNLDKFIEASSAEEGIAKDELTSCFEGLPSQLVVSIMDAAFIHGCTASKDKNLLALLITSQLDKLDLTQWITRYSRGQLNDQMALHLLRTAARRHSPLKSFGFSLKNGSVPFLVFKDLLPSFPNLKKLDVSHSSDKTINDDFLTLVATHCLNLEELRLIGCTGVTDVGVLKLCGSQEGSDVVVPGCKFLVLLNVDETQVTRHGARLALEHLPRLQIFGYYSTFQIAAEMHQTNVARQLKLKNLNANVTWTKDKEVPCTRDTLTHALRLCPFVTDVNIGDMFSLADENLASSLVNLKCLKKLTLTCCPESFSFNGGLLPILMKFGPSSLENFTFGQASEVNIGPIVEHCSNLRELYLVDIRRYSTSRPGLRPSRHCLPHLRRLTIIGHPRDFPEDQPSHADLSLLLSSAPALEVIELECLRQMDDRILEEAIAHHGFPKLESFKVDRSPGITKGVVGLLLELDNPLSQITIMRTPFAFIFKKNPHECHHDPAWNVKILEKNLDLKIFYCECAD